MKKMLGLALLTNFLISANITEKTQKMEKMPGYINMYWDEAEGRVFLEISKLDDELLYVNSLTGGLGSNDIGLDRGQLGSKGRVVYFHKVGKKILLIENIRFYPEEEKNDTNFAKHLASLGDIYVNDAFSCSHRAHASVCEISKFLPSFSGLQLDLEISALKKITSNITKPVTCIIGGSKISTKINIIKNLISKFDNIVIVGAMANNLIEHNGYNIGKSLKEENVNSIVNEILSYSKEKNCNIIFPEDVIVANDLNGQPKIKELNQIKLDEMILDIGPKTVESICNIIDNTNTILWNGPAGYFENPNFANGSTAIAKKIVEKNKEDKIYSVVGGGDTVSLINSLNAVKDFNFVSTAGGAFLEYLEGKELPGISALN